MRSGFPTVGGGSLPSREKLETRFRNYDKKMSELEYEPPSDSEFETLDSIIAGEE